MEVILSYIITDDGKDQLQYVYFNDSEDKDPSNQPSQLPTSVYSTTENGRNKF